MQWVTGHYTRTPFASVRKQRSNASSTTHDVDTGNTSWLVEADEALDAMIRGQRLGAAMLWQCQWYKHCNHVEILYVKRRRGAMVVLWVV